MSRKERFDLIAMHPFWGYVLFFGLLFIVFQCTFYLGAFPVSWIESGVEGLSNLIRDNMHEGPVKDLLIQGIIGGVGGVIVFLPNILLLFLFISIMESSGYMSRAARLMDGMMHRFGLSGHSFIPLIMGFGCNVPAIMATKSIEDRHSRMITILINPLMSCSARLPVYLLLVGAFFPKHAGFVIFGIYVLGIVLALGISSLLRRFVICDKDTPIRLPLPKYKVPSIKNVLLEVWDRAYQYLKKMGGVIMLASILIWFLNYYPINNTTLDHEVPSEHVYKSYMEHIGEVITPVFEPLGFNWKITTSLLTGIAGKEMIVSTLGVLYSTDPSDTHHSLAESLALSETVPGKRDLTPPIALSLLIFVLVYFPCIPTVMAIKNSSGKWTWSLFSIVYTTLLAWVLAYIAYLSASFFF